MEGPAAQPATRRRPVRPRDAATLILIDRRGPALRLLMGRRSSGHSFMPEKWVFPGGRIDRKDFTAPAASDLSAEVAAAIADRLDARRARALAVAAIRETFEETGLLLAAPASTSPTPAWTEFCARGVAPDLGCLSIVARMITPPHRPKRFDTRFFVADADRLVSRQPVDSRELQEIQWLTMDEAMALDLARPTRMMLDHLRSGALDRPGSFLFRRFRTVRG